MSPTAEAPRRQTADPKDPDRCGHCGGALAVFRGPLLVEDPAHPGALARREGTPRDRRESWVGCGGCQTPVPPDHPRQVALDRDWESLETKEAAEKDRQAKAKAARPAVPEPAAPPPAGWELASVHRDPDDPRLLVLALKPLAVPAETADAVLRGRLDKERADWQAKSPHWANYNRLASELRAEGQKADAAAAEVETLRRRLDGALREGLDPREVKRDLLAADARRQAHRAEAEALDGLAREAYAVARERWSAELTRVHDNLKAGAGHRMAQARQAALKALDGLPAELLVASDLVVCLHGFQWQAWARLPENPPGVGRRPRNVETNAGRAGEYVGGPLHDA
jgi:hypothetical protein